ncbi:MAG: 3-deoxy-manno-octulosonate cytidylyltransferase [Desulfobacteraceae bacterium]|nr:MAG: 3-deoxy-manno-octulosonate cytidylyltransferase [Desulfobacteraceae bacterium]
MKIFALIPARYQSARFPGKPLARIAGKPMIQHVYERATSCPEVAEVCVATDDERISACVLEFGGKAVMTRKEHRSGTDRISEAAMKLGVKKEDLIVNIQGDQPLFHPSTVSQLVMPLLKDRSINMTTLKWKIDDTKDIENPNHVKVVTDRQDFALYFSRYPLPFFRDEKSNQAHYKHLGFYCFRMEFLLQFTRLPEGVLEVAEKLEQLRALEHGFKIKVLETPYNSIEVDVPEDIRKVEKNLMR